MMEFVNLSEEELNKLPESDYRAYMKVKRVYEWSQKSLEVKDAETLSMQQYFVGHRDIGSINFEERLKYIGKLLSNPKNSFYGNDSDLKRLMETYQSIIERGEKFTFFWVTKSPFSQWYRVSFKATTLLIEGLQDNYNIKRKDLLNNYFPFDSQEYSSAEQFMMYHKAMIFLDRSKAKQIMGTNDPREIKNLGRQVINYDEDVWQYYRSKIAYEGNKAKFAQNEELKEALFATRGTTLVEAAPNDSIWGIGLVEDDPRALKRETWLGKNLLGEILTQIRIELMGEY